MRPAEYLYELTLPFRSPSALLIGFALFVYIGLVITMFVVNPIIGFALFLFLLIGIAPGITRYLMNIASRRAAGYEVPSATTEMFTLIGSFWSLLPLFIAVAAAAGMLLIESEPSPAVSAALLAAFAIVYPAVVGVLVITHSPIEALNPVELWRLLKQSGPGFWYAPATAGAGIIGTVSLAERAPFAAIAFGVASAFAFFAVAGAVLRQKQLIEAVELPPVAMPPADRARARVEKLRHSALTHAYGFASRGNVASGLDHVDDAIGRDPEPDGAARWYFERMLEWENRDPALLYAQRYLSRLLAQNEQVAAVKLMLRARLENERFRPLPEDLPAAIRAAEGTGNQGLVDALRRL